MTDNRNRTVADVRHYFSKSGGNLGESGCVSWMFEKKGVIQVASAGLDEDKLMELALDAGAEDVLEEEDVFIIHTPPEELDAVVAALEKGGVAVREAAPSMEPKNTVDVTEEKAARALLKLMENLEDHDDVQKVHANFDIDDVLMEAIG